MTSLLTALLLTLAPARTTEEFTVKVEGVERKWVVSAPNPRPAKGPVVFAFHGHGGGIRSAQRGFDLAPHWTEVTMVYMEGIPTVTPNDPKGERNGWQMRAGLMNDRDLKFFDEVVKRTKTDPAQTYAMGHSNGGRFTYLLWAERGQHFAGYSPSGAPSNGLDLNPAPVFHLMGESDPVVNPANQKRTIEGLKTLNGATGPGKEVGEHLMSWEGTGGNPVWAYVHPGGHEYPRDQLPNIAKFFKSVAIRLPK